MKIVVENEDGIEKSDDESLDEKSDISGESALEKAQNENIDLLNAGGT